MFHRANPVPMAGNNKSRLFGSLLMGSLWIGDRIRLIAMSDEPDPIEPGATGIVTGVTRHGEVYEKRFQIDVDWDNHWTLMRVPPPDRFEPADTE